MAESKELKKQASYLSEIAIKCFAAVLGDEDGDAQKLEGLKNCKMQINDLQEVAKNDVFSAALVEVQQQIDEKIEKLLQPEAPPTKKIRSDCDFKLNGQDERDRIPDIIKETQVAPMVNDFDEVAGLMDVKSTLERLLILPALQPQLYANLSTGNCILLYGPPGTGKTRIVHALASEANVRLYCVGASTILSSFVGQTEKNLRELFQYMRRSSGGKKILFIDEVDGLCRSRAQNELEHTRRLKTELMTQLTYFGEYRDAFLICATNCPWDLDVAFMRRFQVKLYVPLPDIDQRFELLKLYTKNTSLEQTCADWGPLLEDTEGYSGSDLNDLVQHALQMPIIRLQEAKAWQKVDDKYKPISFHSKFKIDWSAEHIFRGIRELPPNSVLMERGGDVSDLYEALKLVKRTVSEAEIKRYSDYVQN